MISLRTVTVVYCRFVLLILATSYLSACNSFAFKGVTGNNKNENKSNELTQGGAANADPKSGGLEGGGNGSPAGTVKSSVDQAGEPDFIDGFLDMSKFDLPSNLEAIASNKLGDLIASNGAFTPDGWQSAVGQECSETAIDASMDAAKIKIENNTATVNFNIDAKACNKNYGPVVLTWGAGKGIVKISCGSYDLSKYDGHDFGTAKAELISSCTESGSGSTLFNATLEGTVDLSATGSPIVKQGINVTISRMTADNSGCTINRNGDMLVFGPCRNIVLVQRDNPGISTYFEVAYDELQAPVGVDAFKKGMATFDLNGWKGSVNFGAASAEGAPWTASKDGQKAAGVVGKN